MIRRPAPVSGLLVCDECITVSDEQARGWRALHGTEDDDTEVVVVLRPACAAEWDSQGDA